MQQQSIARMFGGGGGAATTKKQKVDNDGEEEKKDESAPVVSVLEEPQNSALWTHLQDNSWRKALVAEFKKPYMGKLEKLLDGEKVPVYPPRVQIFAALNHTPVDAVRVCIIGQDPYHAAGQAMGLAFSVPRGVAVPSSLRNIYKELGSNIPTFKPPKHGDLTAWATRGVLLLNTSLTVREADAGSHAKQGWETFTDAIVQTLNFREDPVVFLLWGKHAQDKAKKIRAHHKLLKSAHPSGLSASKGFFGNKHFSQCNALLQAMGKDPIDWSLAE